MGGHISVYDCSPKLDPAVFRWIQETLGPFSVDLFASYKKPS